MSFYNTSTVIRDTLFNHPDINVVTMGDFNQVDLNKQTIFPLAHIQPVSSSLSDNTIETTYNVIALDLVDINKSNVKSLEPDVFRGNDNLQDIWASMLNVLNDLFLRLGKEYDDYNAELAPSVEYFDLRFENGLAGCGLSITIISENEHSIC